MSLVADWYSPRPSALAIVLRPLSLAFGAGVALRRALYRAGLRKRVAELQITLPEADAEQMKQRPREINVGIDAQGKYLIDKTVFTFTTAAALADALRKAAGDAKEPVVIINADANATHQSVIHVMEAARMAGYVHITFATQTPPPK